MPTRAPRPCTQPGCTATVTTGSRCPAHMAAVEQDLRRRDRTRGTAASRGYSSRWRRYRRVFLVQHPLCVECLKQGRTTEATEVDHIVPHKGDKQLFWRHSNHQALCKPCHSAKTAKEDGGFGHAPIQAPTQGRAG